MGVLATGSRTRLRLVSIVGLGLLAGCGQPPVPPMVAVPIPDPSSASASASASRTPSPTPSSTATRVAHRTEGSTTPFPTPCTRGAGLQLEWSGVDPALGNRYLALAVTNCTTASFRLPATVPVRPHDAAGAPVPVSLDWQPPQGSLTLAPKEVAYLRMHWLSNGRCEMGATTMDVTVGGASSTVEDCFQLGDYQTETAGSDISSVIDFSWGRTPS